MIKTFFFFCSDLTNHNIGWFLYVWNLIKRSEVFFSFFFLPCWQWEITDYGTDVWQAIDCMRIYSSLQKLISGSVLQVKLMAFLLRFQSTLGQREGTYCGYYGVLILEWVKNPSGPLCRIVHIYFKQLAVLAHTFYGKHLLQAAAAAAANESEPPGNSRGHFKSGIFRLDKGLKFFIHSCAALLF